MKIGIIGSGNIGGNLGTVWAQRGHEIAFGARDPASPKARAALASAPSAQVMTPQQASDFGEAVVIAVPGGSVREVIPTLGDLAGKIVIDTTNRISSSPDDGPSAAEDIAAMLPGARVVKAYNTMAAETLLQPVIGGRAVTAFFCGDDAEAKAVVARLTTEIGLDGVDAGGLTMARYLEGFVFVYVGLARTMGRRIGFRLLRD